MLILCIPPPVSFWGIFLNLTFLSGFCDAGETATSVDLHITLP